MTQKGWLLSSTPWPGCPVQFVLVVVGGTMDEAAVRFRNHFGKDDLEIQTVAPVEVAVEKPE